MVKRFVPIKKTVSLHPDIDRLIREVWSHLVYVGYRGVTYSTALNFLLIAAAVEAQTDNGWSQDTHDAIKQFLSDRASVAKIFNMMNMQFFRAELP